MSLREVLFPGITLTRRLFQPAPSPSTPGVAVQLPPGIDPTAYGGLYPPGIDLSAIAFQASPVPDRTDAEEKELLRYVLGSIASYGTYYGLTAWLGPLGTGIYYAASGVLLIVEVARKGESGPFIRGWLTTAVTLGVFDILAFMAEAKPYIEVGYQYAEQAYVVGQEVITDIMWYQETVGGVLANMWLISPWETWYTIKAAPLAFQYQWHIFLYH